MKQFLFISFLFIILTGMFANHIALADDDGDGHYEHYQDDHNDESPYKEIGKMVGWGAAIAIGSAGVLYPFRRSMKLVMKRFPSAKARLISISKFLGSQHVLIGILALLLSSAHGLFMYLSEDALELRDFIGIGSVVFMLIGSIFGTILIGNKRAKTSRTTHIALLVIALILAGVHILIA